MRGNFSRERFFEFPHIETDLMNKIFKLVWNRARRCWVVASELTKTQGKKSPLIACSVLLTSLLVPNLAKALGDHPHFSLNDQTFFNGSANASADIEPMIVIKAGTKQDGYSSPPLVMHEKDGSLSIEADPTVDDSIVIERGASLQVGPSMEQSKVLQYFTAGKSMINHGVVNIRNKNGVVGNELHVMGDYHGAEGSVLNFSTRLEGSAWSLFGAKIVKLDRMVVYGNTSGTSIVRVTDLGGRGLGGWIDNGPIKLITVHGDSDATFVQDKRIVAGGYDYRLVRGDERYEEGSSKNWYLSDKLLSVVGEGADDKPQSAPSKAQVPLDAAKNYTQIEPPKNQTQTDTPNTQTKSSADETQLVVAKNQTRAELPTNQMQSDEPKTQPQSKPESARELVEYFLGSETEEPLLASDEENDIDEEDEIDEDGGDDDNGDDEDRDISDSDVPDDANEPWDEEETPEERPVAPVVRSAPLPATGKRVIRPEAGSYNSNAWAANTMFQMNLNDRLGSYYQGESGEHRGSAWIRYSGSRNQLDDTSGQLRTKGDKNTVMMGVDMLVHSTDNRDQMTVGLMGGYGHYSGDTRSNLSGYSSRGKVDGYGVGLYGSYQQNADTQQGIYVDSWLLWNAFNNRVKGDDLPNEKYRSKGMTGGLELGYNVKVAERDNVKYVLQPHAQVMYQNVRAENFRESNGTDIEFLNGSRMQTSLGVRAAAHIQTGLTSVVTPHVEANWLHSTKGYGVRMNGAEATMDSGRNAAQLKLGVEGQLNKQLSLNVEMFRNQGNAGYHETGGNLAVKYRY